MPPPKITGYITREEYIKSMPSTPFPNDEPWMKRDKYGNLISPPMEPILPVKKRGRPKKEYKEISVMKAKSDLVKSGDKWAVETNMNIRPTIDDKVKRALKKSVIGEINRQLKGIERGEGIIHKRVVPDFLLTRAQQNARINLIDEELRRVRQEIEEAKANGQDTTDLEEEVKDLIKERTPLMAKMIRRKTLADKKPVRSSQVMPQDAENRYTKITQVRPTEGTGLKKRGRPRKN